MFLIDEQRRRRGTDIDRVDVFCLQPGIGDGAASGFDQKVIVGLCVGDQAGGFVLDDEGSEFGVLGTDNAGFTHGGPLKMQRA